MSLQIVVLQVKGMLKDFGNDMHCQFLEIIRSLLDSYSPAGQVRLPTKFILSNSFVISKLRVCLGFLF